MEGDQHAGPNRTGAPPPGRPAPRRLHPLLAGLGITFVGQVLAGVGTLVLYRLVADSAGKDGFASFALAKGTVSLLFPVVTVGLVAGLPRTLAMTRGGEGQRAEAYAVAAAVICGAVAGACWLVSVTLPGVVRGVFFGGEGSDALVAATGALMLATATFYVAYGWFRGHQRFVAANVLQVLAAAAIPVAVLVAVPDLGVTSLVWIMALALGGLSLAFVAGPLWRGLRAGGAQLAAAGRTLLDYGARRVPGEIAQVALFALVTVVAAHVTSLEDVALLAAAIQLMTVLTVGLTPIGTVLLPSLAERWAADPEAVRRQVRLLAGLAAHLGLFASLQMLVFADVILGAVFGSGFEESERLARTALVAAGPYVFYMIMRSSLDAVSVKSFNTRSNLVGLAMFAGVAAVLLGLDVLDPALAVACAFAAGVLAQGGLTVLFVRRLFAVPVSAFSLGPALALGTATGLAALALHPLVDGSQAPLALIVAVELALASVFFGGLFLAGTGWAALVRERWPR